MVSAGHRGGPSLIWCHRKAKAALPSLPALFAGLLACSSPQSDRTLCKPASMKETSQIHCLPLPARAANTWRSFQSGAQTINRCGFLSLSAGSAWILTNTQTYQRRLAAPLWLPHTQCSHRDELAGPAPRCSISSIYSAAIEPLVWTSHLSWGPPLPVCPSARLSVQVTAPNITGVRGRLRVP